MKLSDEDFLKIIEATPLVSIDLIVRNLKGHILMGKRKNQPARESWFVPGGRIKKGEDLNTALTRISKDELKVELIRDDVRFIGVSDHMYEENFAEVEGISTQYVVLAYECYRDLDLKKLPLTQHSDWKWVCKSQLGFVHKNSAAYFQVVKVLNIDDAGYSALNARRDAFNNLLWQTPIMSLIAQAFLFTIILSPNTEPFPRIIAAILALIVSVTSLQLLVKHRYGEEYHAKKLDEIEKMTGRYPVNQYHEPNRWFAGLKSYRIWRFVLLSFGITALLIPLLMIFWPHLIKAQNKDVNLSATCNWVAPEQKNPRQTDRRSSGRSKKRHGFRSRRRWE